MEYRVQSLGELGKYLNDCYWDVAVAEYGVGQYGKEFSDSVRADMPQGRNGKGTSFADVIHAMAPLSEALRAYQKDDESEDQKMNLDNGTQFKVWKDTLDPDMPLNEFFREGPQPAPMYHSETKLHHVSRPDKSPGTLTKLIIPRK